MAKEDVQRVGVAKEDAEEEEKEEGMFGITYRGSIKTSPKYLTMISIVVFCFVYCCIHDFLFYQTVTWILPGSHPLKGLMGNWFPCVVL